MPLIPVVAPCLTQNYGKQPDNSDTSAGPMLVPVSFDSTWSGDYGIEEGDVSVPLKDGHGTVPAVAYGLRPDAGRDGEARTPSPDAAGRVRLRDPGFNVYEEMAPTLEATAPHSVAQAMVVRRLTPVECARLQGFPDDYLTQVPYRGKPAADGNQYKALGNSFAVPVVRWIGQRIALVDAVARDEGALEVAS